MALLESVIVKGNHASLDLVAARSPDFDCFGNRRIARMAGFGTPRGLKPSGQGLPNPSKDDEHWQ
jgi:hypothetical protein